MPDVHEHHAVLDGEPVFWRQADRGGAVPVLYVHGVPTSGADWTAFLERTGGLAPDLPGFGRSGKRGDGDYTMDAYGPWLERFLDHRGVDRFSLVVHDWGAVALTLAQRVPERIERLVLVNAVPLLGGYRWHRIARVWRTWLLGELLMGSVSRFTIKQLTRGANATKGPMPAAWLDDVSAGFDLGTQRAILRLYRSADPDRLQAAGAALHKLTCPALVAWGDRDPYIPRVYADAYGAVLPGAQTLHLQDAGHWPWLDRPDLVDTVADFLAAGGPVAAD